jgi:hypothetical protein
VYTYSPGGAAASGQGESSATSSAGGP